MASDRYMFFFTRTEPWASLGLLRRLIRVGRIFFGCTLMTSLLLPVVSVIHELLADRGETPLAPFIVVMPFLLGLIWAVGCMFIWRGVHPPPRSASNEPPPPAPPTEGAPRRAPLRPFSPLILSAHAELPDTRNA